MKIQKRKNFLIIIFYHLFLIFIGLLLIFKFSDEILQLKMDLYYRLQINRQSVDSNIDFSNYPAFTADESSWTKNVNLIYHAGGGIDGLDYTNSKEALENTLATGNRYIEIDFAYTSDQELVCMHYWKEQWTSEDAPSLQEFTNGQIFGKYTPMTASDLITYMEKYPDLYVIVDTKESDHLGVIKDLIQLSAYDTSITDRFIIQLYEAGEKAEIIQLYPFSDNNFLFTAYKLGSRFPNKIMNICYEENISVVTVPYGDWDQETLDLFLSKNITIFENTVNRPDLANEELQRGVHGLYTDFLSQEDLNIN